MALDPRLTAMQRRRPPGANPYVGRRGPSTGGIDRFMPITAAPGIVDERARDNATSNDGRIVRDRIPYLDHDRFIPPAQGWVDWTGAGPARPELHMRQMTYRRESGSSRSRFPTVADSPTGGLHTMTPGTVQRTVPRFVQTPQMRSSPYDRLSPGQYSGQTYSQTTTVRRLAR